MTGNAYELDLPQIPTDWQSAIDRFEESPEMARIFPPGLIRNLVMTKRQEACRVKELSEKDLTALYLDTV